MVGLLLKRWTWGRAGVGEPGQTVNLVFRLNRFESYHPHFSFPERFLSDLFLTLAGVAQLVEHQPSKLRVAGSSLVSRSILVKAVE